MDAEDLRLWLKWEIDELLTFGGVGLYEFIWALNSGKFDLTVSEKKDVATDVARDFMKSGIFALYEISWPTGEVLFGPFEEAMLTNSETFPTEPSKRYLALLPL